MSKNRFAGLAAAKQLQETTDATNLTAAKTVVKNDEIRNNVQPEQLKSHIVLAESAAVKRGRPNGKRSNAEFQQVTAYIRRGTYRRVSIKLLDRPQKGEFSELVEELLQEWLAK